MPSPSLTFGFITATLFGATFHLIFGGDARQFALYLLAGWVGFGLGDILGGVFGITIFDIGPLHIVAGAVGALVALAVAHFLTASRSRRRSTR